MRRFVVIITFISLVFIPFSISTNASSSDQNSIIVFSENELQKDEL